MSEIISERSGSILRVALNRPAKKNAMTSSITFRKHPSCCIKSSGKEKRDDVEHVRDPGESLR